MSFGRPLAQPRDSSHPPPRSCASLPQTRALRDRLTPGWAALGGVAVLVARTGVLEREALTEAAGLVLGRQADAAVRAIDAAWTLAG